MHKSLATSWFGGKITNTPMRKMKNGVDIKVKLSSNRVWLSGNWLSQHQYRNYKKDIMVGGKSIYGLYLIYYFLCGPSLHSICSLTMMLLTKRRLMCIVFWKCESYSLKTWMIQLFPCSAVMKAQHKSQSVVILNCTMCWIGARVSIIWSWHTQLSFKFSPVWKVAE